MKSSSKIPIRTLAFVAYIATLTCISPALAVDTLQVTSPDPILEPWRWTEFDGSSGLAGAVWDILNRIEEDLHN